MLRWAVLAGCFWLMASLPGYAQVIDPASTPLDQPAQMTSLASSGLFTAVALAGDRLVAVGERGRIIWSDDNGQSWQQAQTPTSVTLTNVRFISPQEGWAIGQMGVILHSRDGGQSWTLQFDGVRANQALVAAAKSDLRAGGANAQNQANVEAAQQFAAGGPSVPLLALLPLAPGRAVVAGAYGMAFITTDAGGSWQPLFDSIPNPNGLHIYSIVQDGDALFFAGEQGMLLRRAGRQFATLSTPFQGTFFGALVTPAKALLLFGLQGTVLRSVDEGRSWHEVQASDGAGIDCGIVMRNGNILLGDEAGNLLLSRDDGVSFRIIPAGAPVTAVVQAPDGAIITAGPAGLARINLVADH
jgi:photosystem II stability/assembly factor-like uncharacterized protein